MHTYLDVSNLHLRPRTLEALARAAVGPSPEAPVCPAIAIAPYGRGLFFTVPQPGDDAPTMPDDLAGLIAFARSVRAKVVHVHADGEHVASLPSYGQPWEPSDLDITWTVIVPRNLVEDAVGLLGTFERDPEQPDVPGHLAVLRTALESQQ